MTKYPNYINLNSKFEILENSATHLRIAEIPADTSSIGYKSYIIDKAQFMDELIVRNLETEKTERYERALEEIKDIAKEYQIGYNLNNRVYLLTSEILQKCGVLDE